MTKDRGERCGQMPDSAGLRVSTLDLPKARSIAVIDCDRLPRREAPSPAIFQSVNTGDYRAFSMGEPRYFVYVSTTERTYYWLLRLHQWHVREMFAQEPGL
jgi:hypothetical protein